VPRKGIFLIMKRTWVRETTDGSLEKGEYDDINSSLVVEGGAVRPEKDFEPIDLWFDESISKTVAISGEAQSASINAARTDEASWRQYMDFAFGQQGMPRDMAKFVDPQDKFLAHYMIDEFEKGVPHTQSEQQLRAVRFEKYWQLLRFALPPERQQQLDDAMHVAGQDMELFGKNVQNQIGSIATRKAVTVLPPTDDFVLSSHLRRN